MAAIDNIPLHQLLQFARSYAKLGWSVTEQLDDLIERGESASLNINAVKMLRYELAPLPDPLRDLLDRYLEEHGEGQGRYASSDAALRGRLVRLAHSRPDLRADILPLLSDKAACGENTVMAKFEEGKPADPTENMSPEDAAEWKKQNVINKDQFTKGASARRR